MISPRLRMLAAGLCALVLAGCSGTSGEPASAPAANSSELPDLRYVALGDSFTAAPGVGETDRSDGCQRSTDNYPALVAAGLSGSRDVTLEDRSCIGAETVDLTEGQQAGTLTLPPQLDALTEDTDLVTLSMGGNDFGVFTTLVAGCLSAVDEDPAGSPCTDTAAAYGDVLDRAQEQIRARLVEAVAEIRERAPETQVLLVGYPQLVPRDGSCPERLPLAEGDLPFAREVNKSLADNLRRAARRTGVTYVDVWSASAGHDICAEDPWVNGQQSHPSGAVPFHPLPAGQEAVAELVLAEVGS